MESQLSDCSVSAGGKTTSLKEDYCHGTPDVADVSDTGGKDECGSTGKGKKREMDEATYLTSKRPSTSTYSKRTPADSVEKTSEKHGTSVPKSDDGVQDCTTSGSNHISSDTHTVVADIGESIPIATLSEENVPEPEPTSRRSDDQAKVSSLEDNPASAKAPTNSGGEEEEKSFVLPAPSSRSSGTRFGEVLESTGEGAKKDAVDSSKTFENEDELRRCLLIYDVCGLV